jgi:hypothetical protein
MFRAGHRADSSSSLQGSLAPVHRLADFRKIQDSLQGKTMSRVVAKLGSPAEVQDFGGSESWQYNNVAFDPVTKRPVRELTVWFEAGTVDDIRASF